MSLTGPDLVGIAAALCSIGSFAPQAVKIMRERRAAGVSLRMYAVTVTGFALWTIYGFLLKSWPLIVSNLASLGLSGLVLGLTLRFRGNQG